jgi:hypothetical protein
MSLELFCVLMGRGIDLYDLERSTSHSERIIHGYARVDDEITWRIIQDKLQVLRRELVELLAGQPQARCRHDSQAFPSPPIAAPI